MASCAFRLHSLLQVSYSVAPLQFPWCRPAVWCTPKICPSWMSPCLLPCSWQCSDGKGSLCPPPPHLVVLCVPCHCREQGALHSPLPASPVSLSPPVSPPCPLPAAPAQGSAVPSCCRQCCCPQSPPCSCLCPHQGQAWTRPLHRLSPETVCDC